MSGFAARTPKLSLTLEIGPDARKAQTSEALARGRNAACETQGEENSNQTPNTEAEICRRMEHA